MESQHQHVLLLLLLVLLATAMVQQGSRSTLPCFQMAA
jgi:hypothetical protein